MALQTKSISAKGSNGHHTFTLTVTENSTSVSGNTSSISWSFKISGSGNYDWRYSSTVPVTYKVVINGTTYSGNIMKYDGHTTTTLKSGSNTITHNSDGKKSISYSFSVSSISASYLPGSASNSGSMTLTTIPRQANISAAPNFNDEENPTITYSNPAGNNVTSLDACISLTGAKDDVPYRAISKTGTTYTFELTEAERNTLRNACTDANTRTVIFYIKTVIGGNTFYSTVSKTLTIVNANPTITASAKDTKEASLALTGDESKIIKGFNAVYVSMAATAYKGATITNKYITNNGKTYDIVAGTINNVENGTFTYYAQDSRGNTVTKEVSLTMLDYINLTSNLTAEMTVDGVITGNVRGNYFNSTFGTVANTLDIEYRYKVLNGSYGAWTAATATLSGNTYSADITITGLSYKSKYVLQARAVDKLATKNSNEVTLACLPVFDWSGDDFNFNVPITIQDNPLVDYVIEQGSDNEWAYRKWASGLLEAWRVTNSTTNLTIDIAYGSRKYTSTTLSTSGGASQFKTIEDISASGVSGTGLLTYTIYSATVSNGTVNVKVWVSNDVSLTNHPVCVKLRINGRWK